MSAVLRPSRLQRCFHRMPAVLAGLCLAGAVQAQHFAPKAMADRTVRPEVRLAFKRLLAAPVVQRTLDAVRDDHLNTIDDLRLLTEIEAPPFKERRRAEAFLARLKALA